MGLWIRIGLAVIIGVSSEIVFSSEQGYPRSHLLIEPDRLAAALGAKNLAILDARPREAYERSRIPGAVWVDVADWTKAFGAQADVSEWSKRIGNLGIRCDTEVVVYDDTMFPAAARVWWILRYWGVENVRLLNGNWKGWTTGGFPTEKDKPKAPVPSVFQAVARSERLVVKPQMLRIVAGKSLQIVDARSRAEFCGLSKGKNKRAGAIPGAKHLEWTELIDKDSQRFKTAEELRRLFKQAEIDLHRPSVVYCQTGGRASVMAFGMELLGAGGVHVYMSGWSEWGNAEDTPIVVLESGDKPKER